MNVLRQVLTGLARLPRVVRIIMVIFSTLMITLAVVPWVDGVYLESFYNTDTLMLPALVLTIIGVLVYAFGWWLLIGFAGETPAPRWAILWYVMGGFAALILNFVTLVRALSEGAR